MFPTPKKCKTLGEIRKVYAIENSQFTFDFQPNFCASTNAQDIFDIRPLYCTDKDITYTLAEGFRFYGIENI